MQQLDSGAIYSASSETWTWKLYDTLAPQIKDNHEHFSKVGPRRLPQSTLRLIKMNTWTSSCLWDVLEDPWITKMVTQGIKMEPQGLENNNCIHKK